jgi:hypothetical protein
MKETTYWKGFNALGRAIAVAFVIGGLAVGSWSFTTKDWLATSAGFIVATCGVLLFVARPFRPDLKGKNEEKA